MEVIRQVNTQPGERRDYFFIAAAHARLNILCPLRDRHVDIASGIWINWSIPATALRVNSDPDQ
jgi:hypothetical protein